jgi:LCP family protein required for cell wall assembly
MNQYGDENMSGNKGGSLGRKVLYVILAVALFAAGTVGYLYMRTLNLAKDPVRIVDNLPAPTVSQETPALDEIDGTPHDIDLDYEVDIIGSEDVPIYRKERIDPDVLNIMLVGTDLREGEEGNGRSDSCLLVSYNTKTGKISLVSFMRDVWISIPGVGFNRINAAYAYGGIGLLINTVNENFDLDIQNYVLVNFEGFESIVDELGGVEVNLTKKEAQFINAGSSVKVEVKDGMQRLNGEKALLHSRNRKTGDGDFGRTRRQREVLMSIYSKVRTDLSPLKLPALLNNVFKHAKTNITPDAMLSLGLDVLKSTDLATVNSRIPFDNTWKYANKDGRSVISINLQKNRELLHDLIFED